MVFYRRKRVRKTRPARKQRRMMRSMRVPRNRISNLKHTFRREFKLADITDPGVLNARNLVYSFSPTTQLPGLAEYQALYDQIKINKVIFTFEPLWNQSTANGVFPVSSYIRYVHDFDDGTALTTEQQYFDYGNCKTRNAISSRPFQIPLYPLIRLEGAGGVGLQLKSAGYMDIDSTMPTFYGIKMYVPSAGVPADTSLMRVRATVVFTCRCTK